MVPETSASPYPEVMERGVEVFQIETLNPNFHENKGDEHVKEMRAAALSSLYFSPICTSLVKRAVEEPLKDREDLL